MFLSEEEKYYIKFMVKFMNMNEREIKQHPSMINANRRLSTIRYWVSKVRNNDDLFIKSKGRPLSLDENQQKGLIKLVRENPKERFNEIRMRMLRKYKINLKRRTLNNYLLRSNYRVRKAVKRPNLNSKHVDKRLNLAIKYGNDESKINNFIFSDEKKFISNTNSKTEFVTRKIGSNAYDQEFINFNHRSNSNTGLNIWSYIGSFGKGELFVAENVNFWYNDGSKKPGVKADDSKKGFDGPSYLHLIEYRWLPIVQTKTNLNDLIFVQDNASIHKMNQHKPNEDSVYKLLKDKDVTVVDWPEYSPDLNPIENCWSLLDRQKNLEIDKRIQNGQPLPKNKREFFILLKECWSKVDNDQVKKIYFSFFERLKLVIKNKGNNNFNYKSK